MAGGGIVIRGTVLADGSLQLSGPIHLPGPVEVEVRPPVPEKKGEGIIAFFQRIRADQALSGHSPRTAEEIDSYIRELRDEWDEQSREIEEFQERCRLARETVSPPSQTEP